MVQSTLFIFLATLLINISYCSTENVYCVTPSVASCSSCPHNSNNCTTLSEYSQQAELYFTSNTTMVFLPGNHTLDRNIKVANVAKLVLRGKSSSGNIAEIVCNASVGLKFTSIVGFRMYSLALTFCNRNNGNPQAGEYALFLESTHNAELVNCSFHNNLDTALLVNNSDITLAGNTEFKQNHCDSTSCIGGAGIVALSSNLTFTGNITFLENSGYFYAPELFTTGGSAIYASGNTVLSFNGTSNFINNIVHFPGAGGAIYASQNAIVSFNGINNFISNSANYGAAGGAIYTSGNTVVSFNGTNNFINNSADRPLPGAGGAICASKNAILSFNGTNNFISNSANYGAAGGAVYAFGNTVLSFNGTNNFISNSAESAGGGAISTSDNAVLTFNGTNNFIYNSADYGGSGGAIYTSHNTALSFNSVNNFTSNSAAGYAGGAIYMFNNTLFSFNGTNNFINNSVYDGNGGAIMAAVNTTIIFNGIISFTNNAGGGMYLGLKTTFSIFPNTTIYWENTHATLGGAIYVADNDFLNYCSSVAAYITKEECFFQLPGQNLSNGIDVQLIFKNNSADAAGSVLYGGAIDNCKLNGLESCNSGEVFDMIAHIENNNTMSTISSDPLNICACENNDIVCNKDIELDVYPGETFQVFAVAVGQRDGTVPSTVRSSIDFGDIPDSQYLQQANNTCTKLNYTVFSLSQVVNMNLYAANGPCPNYDGANELQVSLTLNQTCPPGFNISELAKSCVCEPRLAHYTNQCNITNGLGRISRDPGQHFWVGYDNQSHEVILHPHCPFDYCVYHTVVFPLNDTDMQCAYDRLGLLCGKCGENYSLVLGTSQCKQCNNNYLFLLITFAVMGIALVFFLFVCKLTVATGTLSGLVLYANIVGANRTIFLPASTPLSVFIAWLNLDFGIETCFYNGLDAYNKTWLQFVFPVYIWVIVGLVIFVSHFSHRCTNLLGNNPVSVLATLIFLAYTKILRTLITVLYITYLEYPTYNRMLWLCDANVDYLSGKHIPLFIVATLVLLFLFFPYTLLLLFGQWLQSISHLRLFSWVNSARLKPFIDAYHAPYKARHRYWPGLLLVLRLVLLLVFALEFNPQQDSSITLLAILVGTGALQMWAWVSGGVYRNWCLDALESSFALNLIILVRATFYVQVAGGNQLAVGCTSVSIALLTFLGILAFQLAHVTGIAQYLRRKCATIVIRDTHHSEAEVEPLDIGFLPDRLVNPQEYEPPLHTTHGHNTTERTEREEAGGRLTPVYTYGSI